MEAGRCYGGGDDCVDRRAARPSGLLLSASAAAVAAATAYTLDDPAAATLQSSPTTLLRRHAHRITLTLPLLVAFWTLATMIVQRSPPDVPSPRTPCSSPHSWRIALAAASTMVTVAGYPARGGTFGTLTVIVCFGTAVPPGPPHRSTPPPTPPGPAPQLVIVLAIAVALLLASSTDPARRLLQLGWRRAPRTV